VPTLIQTGELKSITHEDQKKAVAYTNSSSRGSFVWSSVRELRLSPVHQYRTPNPKRNRTTDDRSKEEQRELGRTIRKIKGELNDSLNEAGRGLEKPIERARSRVQQFGELVERVGEKIVVMVKKILSMLDGKKEKSKGNTRTLFKR
jgi:hypothetical protein